MTPARKAQVVLTAVVVASILAAIVTGLRAGLLIIAGGFFFAALGFLILPLLRHDDADGSGHPGDHQG